MTRRTSETSEKILERRLRGAADAFGVLVAHVPLVLQFARGLVICA
ncbi:MAG: hypothetical protein OEY86_03060 [Nitrospira sp.]|nr:hypothetical protein [Nitrospira sp.]